MKLDPGQIKYYYLLFAEDWPFKIGWPFITTVPVARGDTLSFELQSDIAVHRFELQVVSIKHEQIGDTDAGCFLDGIMTIHDAKPVSNKRRLTDTIFLRENAKNRIKPKPKLKVVK